MKQLHPARALVMVLVFPFFLFSCKPQDEIDRRVEELLKQMTLEEKVGQMTQITLDAIGNGETVHESLIPFDFDSVRLHRALVEYHVGSILNTTNNYAMKPQEWNRIVGRIQEVATTRTRLKIPVIYGVDAIHGTTYTDGGILFPHQMALAATFNPIHAYNMAVVTAYETRASGIPWNFSPVLDLGADPRYSRMLETFGEDPYLISVMGEYMIRGYEGMTDSIGHPTKVASCMKHFLGYSVPFSGKDRTPAFIPDHILREYHLEPFKRAIEAGAATIMINSGIINGVSVHASYEILTELLRNELGFEGVILSDWQDIINLNTRDRIAETNREAVKLAINAGIDMSMVPYNYEEFCKNLIDLVRSGEVKESRIDDAVRRILRLKFELNLFETPMTYIDDYPNFGSKEHELMSFNAAAEAITLLKNEGNILPLKEGVRVLVTGPNANSMRAMNGAWSYSWQGEKTERFTQHFNTFFEALQLRGGANNVTHIPGVSYIETGRYFEEEENRFQEAIQAARGVDVVLLFLGENSYAEKPGDLNDLNMSSLQTKLAKALIATGKPVILVINSGRPRCFSVFEPGLKAVVNTYLPSNYGGDALAAILYGDINPSGKLPYTYPAYPNSIVNYYHKPSERQNASPGAYNYASDFNPQYEFGHGLSYTTFAFTNLQVSKTEFSGNDVLEISVDVANTGNRYGKEVVMLFSSDLYASITPDVKRLRRFHKVGLQPGEKQTVKFNLSATDLAFVNIKNEWVTEPGEFVLSIGDLKASVFYQ